MMKRSLILVLSLLMLVTLHNRIGRIRRLEL